MPLPKEKGRRYTYKDYINWPDDERWEIIDGEAYNMTPAPAIRHQQISMRIIEKLFLNRDKLKDCTPFFAPTDVVLDEYNVVQPDIFIICDRKKITENNIQGAPELVIEIISKTTAYKDTKLKRDLYERAGVREYIIIYPELEIVERYMLEDKRYGAPDRFNWDEALKLSSFDIEIPLWEVFEKERIGDVSTGQKD